MSDSKTSPETLQEHLTPTGPSRDPDYLEWRDREVTRALEEARANPEKSIPEHKVWKKFGLEY